MPFVALCTTYAFCFVAFAKEISSHIPGMRSFSFFYIGAIYFTGHLSGSFLGRNFWIRFRFNSTYLLCMLCVTCHARVVPRSIDVDIRSSRWPQNLKSARISEKEAGIQYHARHPLPRPRRAHAVRKSRAFILRDAQPPCGMIS